MIKQDIAEFKPQLLWLQWQGMQTPGRRDQTKLLRGFLQECIRLQLQHGGHCVLETRSSDIPIREEIMQGPTWLALLPHASHVRGCALLHPRHVERCHGQHLIASFPVRALRCHSTCREPTSSPSVDVMQIYPAFVQHTLHHYAAALAVNPTVPSTVAISSPSAPSDSITTAPSASLFPTEAALRAKQRIRAHQSATGDKPVVQHKRKPQEIHSDDCGDDFSSILDADT
eukprot:5455886-Amphidinium_carterae.1